MNRFIVAMWMLTPFLCFAQPEGLYKHEVQFTGGLNSQSAYEMELAYSFLFNQYVGVTFGLNMMDQSFDRMFCNGGGDRTFFQSLFCDCNYDDWLYGEANRRQYASAILVRPAMRLRLPIFKEAGEDVLLFNVETGLFFNLIPNERLTYGNDKNEYWSETKSVKNKGGEWLYYHLKGYLSINIDRFLISAGYSFSDFDIFDSRRNIVMNRAVIQDTLRNRKKTSTVFFALTFLF